MLDFRTETFLCVCRHMNFTRAAGELGITQPAVSQHIHFLEEYYHARLFAMNGKKLSLTEQGEHLRRALTTIRDDEALLQKELQEIAGRTKPLAIGATMTVSEYLLPRPLSRFIKAHPEKSLKLILENTRRLRELLDSGDLDLAVVEGHFPSESYDFRIWKRLRFIPVAAASHRFPDRRLAMEDLFSETLLLREPGSGTREILARYLESCNYDVSHFSKVLEITNMHSIQVLAEEDCGITFLYEAVAEEALQKGTLIRIPLQDFELSHNISFIWRRNSIFAEEYQNFFRELS